MKKLFIKVYQDRNCIDTYFVERIENLPSLLEHDKVGMKENEDEDHLPAVYEPVLMTEEEFKNLPEFLGF